MDHLKIYELLIARALVRSLPTCYCEKHHILPKSIFPDLKNDPNNIVVLTAKEHFLAHLLLAKIYGGKMIFAASSMANNGKYTGRKYQWLKEGLSKYLSETRTGSGNPAFGKPISDENRRKRIATRTGMPSPKKGKPISEETKRKISEVTKGERNPFYGKTHTLETKKRISEAKIGIPSGRKGYKMSDETKKKLSIASTGRKVSEETKQKIKDTFAKKRSLRNKI